MNNNNYNNNYKIESLVIFYCIIVVILIYFLILIYNKTYKTYREYFSSNDSKRNKMLKIYKSNDILGPETNQGDNDPDSSQDFDID